MQNLFWKFSVLAGVIGASCFVVWQAHESLSETKPETDPSEFLSLESRGNELTQLQTSAVTLETNLQPVPGLNQPEPEPTLAETPHPGMFSSRSSEDSRQVDQRIEQDVHSQPIAQNTRAFPNEFPKQEVQPTQPAHDPVAEANPFLAMSQNQPTIHPASHTTPAGNPFAEQEESKPKPSPEPMRLFGDHAQPQPAPLSTEQPEESTGLTTLPPSHPGPLLLPAQDQFPQAEMPQQNRLQTAEGIATDEPHVQTIAGNAFLPLSPNQPEEQAEEVLPVLAEPTPFQATPTEQPQLQPVMPAEAGFGAPALQPQTPEVSPNPFAPQPRSQQPNTYLTPGNRQPAPEPLHIDSAEEPESEVLPVLNSATTPKTEPVPFDFGNSSTEPEPANFNNPPVQTPAEPTFSSTPTPTSSFPSSIPEQNSFPTNNSFSTNSSTPTNSSIPVQQQIIDHELIGDGIVDASMPSGPQSPELKIEKIAPLEASIGQPLVYSIIIRNVGGSEANNVIVEDRIPRGAKLDGTIPQAVFTNGKLIWDLGSLAPGAEKTIQLKVIPVEAGDIGSVATVRFAASVSTSIRVTAPKLNMKMSGPSEVLVGKPATYDFVVTNTGLGGAKSVFLRAIIPPGLLHPGGNDLEYEIGDLAPKESKTVQLAMTAQKMGIFTPQAIISIDGDPKAEAKQDLRIIESRLQVARSGPTRRFVGRPGTYVTKVTNQSSEVLRTVEVIEEVPHNVEPSAQLSNWDPARRVIVWTIPIMQPGETKQFTTELTPSQPGDYAGRLTARDTVGNQAMVATALDVKGIADLDVDIDRDLNPIAVGEQLSLRMSVANTGNASARNVQTQFLIPNSLQFVTAKGPGQHRYDPNTNVVTFEPIPEFEAGGVEVKKEYDIVLTGLQAGKAEVKVNVDSKQENGDNDENQQFTKTITVLGYEVDN